MNLWDHVDPEVDEPLLKKPRMPLVGSYQRQVNNRRANAGSSQNAERQTVDRSQTVDADDNDDQDIAPSALSDRGRAALQLDMQYYTQQEKEFREQHNVVQKLKKWVTDMIAPHYVEVACEATEMLSKWYSNLKDQVGISDVRSQIAAREQYMEALKLLTKSKDWSKWLSNWKKAMSLAQKKKVPEALLTSAWISLQP